MPEFTYEMAGAIVREVSVVKAYRDGGAVKAGTIGTVIDCDPQGIKIRWATGVHIVDSEYDRQGYINHVHAANMDDIPREMQLLGLRYESACRIDEIEVRGDRVFFNFGKCPSDEEWERTKDEIVKQLPDRQWHPDQTMWSVPNTDFCVGRLIRIFSNAWSHFFAMNSQMELW